MKIEFTSVNELREFVQFVNEAKDEVLAREALELNKVDKELKQAVVDSKESQGIQGEKTNAFTSSR